MSRVICITSGKGGVGKTTTAVSLAHLLGKEKNTLLIDANLTTPNVNIHLGAPILKKHLMHVLTDKAKPEEAIYTHKSGLLVMPATASLHDLKFMDYETLKDLIFDLRTGHDIIVLDSAAGLGKEAISAMEASDEIIIVTNPELSAVVDAQKTIQVASEIGKLVLGVVVNKISGHRSEMKIKEIENMLGFPVIGEVPYDINVKISVKKNHPVTHHKKNSKASKEFGTVVSQIIGPKYTESEEKKEKNSLFKYVLKMLGF
jgi:cell division ATPase MinD